MYERSRSECASSCSRMWVPSVSVKLRIDTDLVAGLAVLDLALRHEPAVPRREAVEVADVRPDLVGRCLDHRACVRLCHGESSFSGRGSETVGADPTSVESRAIACSRISVSDCRGVSASGSTRSSITAGRPAPSAASKAAAKSSVRSTTAPCAPNASASAREVGVDEVGAGDAARVVALLVHANRPEHAVVDDEHDDRSVVLHRRRELLAGHQEVAVARDRDHVPLGMEQLGGNRRGHAVPHRTARRRELGRVVPELVEAMRPDREVAGAVREDRVRRQPGAHGRHHLAHVEVAGHREAAEVVEIVLAPLARPLLARARLERRQRREGAGERVGRAP